MMIETTLRVSQAGIDIATCTWQVGDPVARAILYPGWLDNAGSFDTVAPLLARAGVHCTACDPPGCGKSSHLPLSAAYCDYFEVGLLGHLMQQIGWSDKRDDTPRLLIAHSRGGGIALAAAGAFAGMVDGVVLFENENWGECASRPVVLI